MRKVISLFLTLVMTLSVFSCLSVMAAAATADLVVDQEYVVSSGTTKTFIPKESGYYKFESNGYGDTKITVNCMSGEYVFDDENGSDFSGVIELEAGEEVSCYLYNYNGEDCVFTITKTIVPESVSFDFSENIEIVENTNGWWNEEEIWDEKNDDYKWVEYYVYETPFHYCDGDTITLKYSDGTKDVYTCEEEWYYNEQGEVLDIDVYSEQNYENRWKLGSDNYFTANIMGKEYQFSVTIVENPNSLRSGVFVAEKVTDDTCVITSIETPDSFDGVLDVPAEIKGYNVVGIEDGVLGYVDDLEEINLPSTFNMISDRLFDNCDDLEAINVAKGNTVFASVNGVLYNKAYTKILYCPEEFDGKFVIKAGVKELSPEIIARLSEASSVEVEKGNTAFGYENGVLYNADFTKIYKAISIGEEYVMKSTVKEIADYSFSGNETVKKVVFSAGVTEIAYAAFADCSRLSTVELPTALVSIADRAFHDSGLKSITLPGTTRKVGGYAFFDCESLSKVKLNSGLKSLGNNVFSYTAIEKVVLPNTLTKMGEHCFSFNKKLSDVTIGTALTTIPYGTFDECSALKSIEIPENITVIGKYSFSGTGLTSIHIPDKVTKIDNAFVRCESLVSAYVGSSVKTMEFAFSGCENLKTVDFGKGFKGSGTFAFSGCSALSDIDIPSTVTEFAYAQFKGCKEVDNFDIPESLYKIEAHALDDTGWYNSQSKGAVYLEHVLYQYKGSMPADYTLKVKTGTKSIADSALECQKKLVKAELPKGLRYIGAYAFDGCTGLASITIPGSIEYIGEYALGYSYNNGGNIEKHEDFVIYGYKDTVAYKYAKEYGIKFVEIQHTHTAGSWITDKKATVYRAGEKHKECTECGKILKTTEIAQLKCAKAVLKKVSNVDGYVNLTWGKVAGADSYRVYRKVGTGSYEYIGSTTGTSYTDKKAPAGKTCRYIVKVKNEAGISDGSASLALKHIHEPKIKTISNSEYGVKITWGKITGAKTYSIYRKVSGGEYKYLGATRNTYYTDKTASSGKKYYYAIRAKDDDSVSSQSDLRSKYYLADPTLKTPSSTTKGVGLEWTKVVGAEGYVIYRKTGSSGSYTKIKTEKGVSNLFYRDETAKKGKKYYYKVKAYKSTTYSAFSNTKSITDKY